MNVQAFFSFYMELFLAVDFAKKVSTDKHLNT